MFSILGPEICHLTSFRLSSSTAEEGEEGEEDSPLSYDKLIMPGVYHKCYVFDFDRSYL